MKKLATILLAIAFVATLTVASFAAEVPAASSQDLGVSYEALTAAGTVYSVDVVWSENDFTFEYDAGEQGTWNPQTHAYDNAVAGQWTDDTVSVTVTNHSNAAVKATLALSDVDNDFTFTYEDEAQTLAAGVENKPEEAAKFVFDVVIDGTPTEAVSVVAKATVSFAAANG